MAAGASMRPQARGCHTIPSFAVPLQFIVNGMLTLSCSFSSSEGISSSCPSEIADLELLR